MDQFWQWVATDRFGKSQKYQSKGYDVSESTMRDFLIGVFPGCTMTDIKRITTREIKDAIGPVETHVYQFGIAEAAFRAGRESALRGVRPAIKRETIQRESLLQSRSIIRPR